MTIHATMNPVGSTNPKDLMDNAQNLDYLILGPLLSYPDRRGVNRLSWAGIETAFAAAQDQRESDFDSAQEARQAAFEQFLNGSGYSNSGDYAAGITLTSHTQYVVKDGQPYRLSSAIPVPYITTGVWASESLNFVLIGDNVIRQDLSDPNIGGRLIKFMGTDVDGILKTFVHTKAFGAPCDGVTDDTNGIRLAIDFAVANGVSIIETGQFPFISGSIVVPVGKTVRGQGRGCRLTMSSSGTFIGGFAFLINSNDGVNPIVNYPNTLAGGVEQMTLYNGNGDANRRGVKGFGSCEIGSLRGYKMWQMVARPAGEYSDNFEVRDVYNEPVMGSEFQVDIRGLGDGLIIESLHFPYNQLNPGDGTPNALYVGGALGGSVSACIGGNVTVFGADVVIRENHFERGQLTIDSCNPAVENNVFFASNKIPIVFKDTDQHNYFPRVRGNVFGYTEGLLMWQGSDVQVSSRMTVDFQDNFRRYTKNGDLSKSQISGIKLENSAGVALADWNNYSYLMSAKGRVFAGGMVERNHQMFFSSNSFTGISGISLDASTTWNTTSGTRYYRIQLILDSGRAVGRNSTAAEVSVAVTSGGSGVRLDVSYGSRIPGGILRVFSGDTSGAYDKFADIHAVNTARVYDNGGAINGVPWVARAPTALPTINDAMGESEIRISGTRAVFVAAGVPVTGTWAQNDEIERSNVAAGGKRGNINITAGAPAFKAWGAIDA
jgi:hypothetical protein